jgi:hypothetical protein
MRLPTTIESLLAGVVLVGLFVACQPMGDGDSTESSTPSSSSEGPPPAEGVEPASVPSESPPPKEVAADPLATGLPEAELPRSGPGTYVWAPGGTEAVGGERLKTYSVGVEQGLDIDVEAFAAFVDAIYSDPRSWTSDPRRDWGFQRVEQGGIRIVIATPATVDKQCLPLKTEGKVSCARQGYISLNLDRWELAVPHWDKSLSEYRRYVVNHEMGHYLGKPHVGCPEPGALAPTMMQQTYFLKGCTGNPWPYPEAATTAASKPAAEGD